MPVIRRAVELMCRSRVLRRRLPKRCGRRSLFVSPDSALKYLLDLESSSSELFDVANTYVNHGSVVWDVGANVGVFALAAANKAGPEGQVVAIEADPFLASLLQRSSQLPSNRDINLLTLCAAASDTVGIARFLISERGRSTNALEQVGLGSQTRGARYTQYVPTVTLDTLLNTLPSPEIIKVDVERAEEYVLRGARNVLAKSRPLWYIEVGPNQNAAVTAIFKEFDYKLYSLGSGQQRVDLDRCAFNTLAMPRERTT